jgi:hypothetical protein
VVTWQHLEGFSAVQNDDGAGPKQQHQRQVSGVYVGSRRMGAGNRQRAPEVWLTTAVWVAAGSATAWEG